MNNNKWRIIMPALDKIISIFPFFMMIAVSFGGIVFSRLQNKKMDEEEKNNK